MNFQTFFKQKWVIIASAAALALLLVGSVVFFIVSLQKNSGTSPLSQNGLLPNAPAASEQAVPTQLTTPNPNFSPLPSPASSFNPASSNLAVTVDYQRGSAFTLTIRNLTRTAQQPTIARYQPLPSAPYSSIRLLDSQGNLLREDKFAVATLVHGDGEGTGGVQAIEKSSAYLVLPISADKVPAQVVLLSAQGAVLAEQKFDFQALPQSENSISAKPSLLNVLAHWLTPTAKAKTNQSFTIAVINEQGAQDNVDGTVQAAQGILAVAPWNHFAQQIDVVGIKNTTSNLGCTTIQLANGRTYPYCPDDSAVMQAVAAAAPQWNVILVVTDFDCNCGTVAQNFPPITALGKQVDFKTISHEMGHAVGQMMDEYFYQFGFTDNIDGPNCFASAVSCQQAVANFPGAVCQQGCSTIRNWRPSSRIMHNTYQPLEYGPLEECIMGTAISQMLGEQYDCLPPSSTPSPGSYWGWHR